MTERAGAIVFTNGCSLSAMVFATRSLSSSSSSPSPSTSRPFPSSMLSAMAATSLLTSLPVPFLKYAARNSACHGPHLLEKKDVGL